MNLSFIIMEVNHGYIDSEYSTFHGYHIIKFSSYLYTLQYNLSIDGQVISSGEMVCEGTFFSYQYQLSLFYFSKNNTITQLYCFSHTLILAPCGT